MSCVYRPESHRFQKVDYKAASESFPNPNDTRSSSASLLTFSTFLQSSKLLSHGGSICNLNTLEAEAEGSQD